MKYCQGPKCHMYDTKDRLRGPQGAKTYQTRRRTHLLFGEFCDNRCWTDWTDKYIERALNHFGRIHEPIKLTEDNAWYKWSSYNGYDNTPRYNRFFINDLTDQRIPITEEQYNDDNLVRP